MQVRVLVSRFPDKPNRRFESLPVRHSGGLSRDCSPLLDTDPGKMRDSAGFRRLWPSESEPETAGSALTRRRGARLSLLPSWAVRFGDPAGSRRAGNAARVCSTSSHLARHAHGQLQTEKRPRPFFAVSPYKVVRCEVADWQGRADVRHTTGFTRQRRTTTKSVRRCIPYYLRVVSLTGKLLTGIHSR